MFNKYSKIAVFFLSALTLLLAPLSLAAEDDSAKQSEIKYAVMPFSIARGVDEQATKLLDEVFLSKLSSLAGAKTSFMGSSDISAMIGFEAQKQLLACDDTGCMAEVGNALGVDFLLIPSLGRLGDSFIINVKVIEPGTGKVLRRGSFKLEGKEDKLAAAMSPLASAALGLPMPENSVLSNVDGSQNDSKRAATKTKKAEKAGQQVANKDSAGPNIAGLALSAGGAVLLIASVGLITWSDVTLTDAASSGESKDLAKSTYWGGIGGTAVSLISAGIGAFLFISGDE